MKNVFRFSIFLSFLIYIGGITNAAVFRGPGFQITCPEGWQSKKPALPTTALLCTNNAGASINVVIKDISQAFPEDVTNMEFSEKWWNARLNDNINGFKEAPDNPTVNKSGFTKLSNKKALEVQVTQKRIFSGHELLLKSWNVQTFNGTKAYSITCGTVLENFEKMLPAFKQAVGSFKFLSEP